MVVTGAGCGAVSAPGSNDSASQVSTAPLSAGQRIVVRFGDEVVPATLADTPAGRQLEELLPLTVELRDPMGQAKSGRLPTAIDTAGSDAVTDPAVGGIYYDPASQTLAVFYDDLGQSVPPPGLVRLGAVDSDLSSIAAAGNRFQARIGPADDASS